MRRQAHNAGTRSCFVEYPETSVKRIPLFSRTLQAFSESFEITARCRDLEDQIAYSVRLAALTPSTQAQENAPQSHVLPNLGHQQDIRSIEA